jgi:hypothetical protein
MDHPEEQDEEQEMKEKTLLDFLKQHCRYNFREDEAAALFHAGFNTKASLAGVTRDDLTPVVKLRPAAVKMLVSAFSGGSGLPIGWAWAKPAALLSHDVVVARICFDLRDWKCPGSTCSGSRNTRPTSAESHYSSLPTPHPTPR